LSSFISRSFLVLVVLIYPAIVYFGMDYLGPAPLAMILVLLLAVRLFANSGSRALFWPISGVLALFVLLVWFTGDQRVLRAYPVIISLALFTVFAGSLLSPPPIIERLVRLREKTVRPPAIPYLRWVTIGWSCFFLINAAIAAWTAWIAPLEYWAIYNGLISYLLVALVFAVEYIIRRIYKRRVYGDSSGTH